MIKGQKILKKIRPKRDLNQKVSSRYANQNKKWQILNLACKQTRRRDFFAPIRSDIQVFFLTYHKLYNLCPILPTSSSKECDQKACQFLMERIDFVPFFFLDIGKNHRKLQLLYFLQNCPEHAQSSIQCLTYNHKLHNLWGTPSISPFKLLNNCVIIKHARS